VTDRKKMNNIYTFLGLLTNCMTRFFSVAGWRYVFGCSLLAISRFFKLLTFFLPIKIFLVMNGEKVPEYLATLFPKLEFDSLILILVLLVPILYVCFFISTIAHNRLVGVHLELFLKSGETTLKSIKKLHKHTVKAFADFGVIVVSLVMLLLVDYPIAIICLIIIIITMIFFDKTGVLFGAVDRILFARMPVKQFIELVTSVNFLFIFFFIVIEFLFFDTGIYAAIFALLVGRLMCQALHRLSIEFIYIAKFF